MTRADISTFLRCLVHAREHFGGCPETILLDNMKTVKLGRPAGAPPTLRFDLSRFAHYLYQVA